MNELSESKEIIEWQEKFVWLEPAKVNLENEELHWQKITPEIALESFDVLKRMRPFIEENKLENRADVLNIRDRLAQMNDADNANIFSEKDLRFFDLYFGNDRIKIERVGDNFDVTNGRHRLSIAQKVGLKELPVLLNEKILVKQKKEMAMGSFELAEIEEEAVERGEEAEGMQTEIEQHQERADKLAKESDEIRAVLSEVGSDEMREAQSKLEDAKAETKKQLEKLEEKRNELLRENEESEKKLIEQNEKRRPVREKMARMKTMFAGASAEFKENINQANNALNKDLEHFSDAQKQLQKVRQKLEEMNFEVKS